MFGLNAGILKQGTGGQYQFNVLKLDEINMNSVSNLEQDCTVELRLNCCLRPCLLAVTQ